MDIVTNWINNFGSWMLDGLKDAVVGLLEWVSLGIIDNSYWVCLIVGIVALIMYISGQRKAGKYVSASLIIYFILQSLGIAIRGAK